MTNNTKGNLRKWVVGFGVVAILQANMASASNFQDYAEVIDVEPLTKTIRVSQPRQECWNEQVSHRTQEQNTGGMIIGGILGGALGSRVGKGNGNKAAIAAGTLLGAGIGQQTGRSNGRVYTTNEQRCQTVNDYYEEDRITGYRVAYNYNGHTYYTQTSHYPGKRIPVRVSVTPAL